MKHTVALLVQASVAGLAFWKSDCFFDTRDWIVGVAVPFARLGFSPAWPAIVFVALLLSGFLLCLSKPAATGAFSAIRLVAVNACGAALFFGLSAAIVCLWPVSLPRITPFDDGDPRDKPLFLAWYKTGYRDGMVGGPWTSCVFGWNRPMQQGYWRGYLCGTVDIHDRIRGRTASEFERALSALHKGDPSLIENISDPNATNQERTVLMYICESGLDLPETVRHLIVRGAHIRVTPLKDIWRQDALYCAILGGKLRVVKVLAEAHAFDNMPSEDLSRLLMAACGSGDTDVVKYLLAKGAQINDRNAAGDTPLRAAVAGSNVETARFLIASGADVNARNNEGECVLDAVPLSFFGHYDDREELAELLLRNGCDMALATSSTQTALSRFLPKDSSP